MKNKNLQTEIDASYLYQQLADHEQDKVVAHVFQMMSEIERGHVKAFAARENISDELKQHTSRYFAAFLKKNRKLPAVI